MNPYTELLESLRQRHQQLLLHKTQKPMVSSSLVGKQKWGRDVLPCWRCGFSPVRLEAMRDNHGKEFAYTCPNEDCEEVWKSPPMKLWKRSKVEAADVWDAVNDGA